MKTALIGYGKMGRQIEAMLLERGHDVVLVIDKHNSTELTEANLREKGAEVAIEFSTPQTAFENIAVCLRAGIAVVSGTTGWLDNMSEVERLCNNGGGAFFYASNFSIGVNIMFKVNAFLAKLMNMPQGYDVSMEEVHHVQKKDAPSGTAITLAEGIIDNYRGKTSWVGHTTTEPAELEVLSVRRGSAPGTHVVTYESDADILTLSHCAKNRMGFASGAVLAAEFVCGKEGVYTMDDLLEF